ncbi:fungal class II heme-containing peroxidase [Dionaea muscipula]
MGKPPATPKHIFALVLVSFSSFHVALVGAAGATSGENPFTAPKAYLIRYWNDNIYKVPRSEFLVSKASPLSAAEAASFAQLASQNSLSTHLDRFCKSAHLFCNAEVDVPNVVTITLFGTYSLGKGRRVEPGMFFREKMLKSGVVMPMPDIRDKMPQRAFLPRSIISKIPFSSSKAPEIKEIFHAFDNSTMETIIESALRDCERAPSQGEKKRCVGSAEDMIDFAVSVLGRSMELRTTNNVNGSGKDIMVGKVRGINGGRVTQSVSCHPSLYPYLLYHCHSVPKVRVYEADILDPINKAEINHGVAICHVDTSAWSPTNVAFSALESGPGKIEVCHWIFENDLTWTIAN